jgi:hypothetical protein
MAAPTNTWKFVYDLWGNRIPKVITLEATASLETKVGTLLFMSSGQVDNAGASASSLLGLAVAATTAAATAADPVKVYVIAPGMVIRGTADADASTLQGFNGKTGDLNSDGSLDVADSSNGCLSVFRVNDDDGLVVDCVITEFDMGPVN